MKDNLEITTQIAKLIVNDLFFQLMNEYFPNVFNEIQLPEINDKLKKLDLDIDREALLKKSIPYYFQKVTENKDTRYRYELFKLRNDLANLIHQQQKKDPELYPEIKKEMHNLATNIAKTEFVRSFINKYLTTKKNINNPISVKIITNKILNSIIGNEQSFVDNIDALFAENNKLIQRIDDEFNKTQNQLENELSVKLDQLEMDYEILIHSSFAFFPPKSYEEVKKRYRFGDLPTLTKWYYDPQGISLKHYTGLPNPDNFHSSNSKDINYIINAHSCHLLTAANLIQNAEKKADIISRAKVLHEKVSQNPIEGRRTSILFKSSIISVLVVLTGVALLIAVPYVAPAIAVGFTIAGSMLSGLFGVAALVTGSLAIVSKLHFEKHELRKLGNYNDDINSEQYKNSKNYVENIYSDNTKENRIKMSGIKEKPIQEKTDKKVEQNDQSMALEQIKSSRTQSLSSEQKETLEPKDSKKSREFNIQYDPINRSNSSVNDIFSKSITPKSSRTLEKTPPHSPKKSR